MRDENAYAPSSQGTTPRVTYQGEADAHRRVGQAQRVERSVAVSFRTGGLLEAPRWQNEVKTPPRRVLIRRKTLRLRAQPVRRCPACLLVRDEVAAGFICAIGVCPRKFQLVTLISGVVIE